MLLEAECLFGIILACIQRGFAFAYLSWIQLPDAGLLLVKASLKVLACWLCIVEAIIRIIIALIVSVYFT